MVLLAGTAVAAYAALNQHPAPPAATMPLAQAPPATTPSAPVQPAATGPTGPATAAPPVAPAPASTPPAPKPAAPKASPSTPKPATSKPAASTPAAATPASERPAGTTSAAAPTSTAREAPKTSTGTGEPAPGKPQALLLDTNAASTYNPCRYPASSFGEPYLAIDDEPTSAWHAVIEPGAHPQGPAPARAPTGPTGPTTRGPAETGTGSAPTITPAELCEGHATGAGLALELVTPQRLATLALDTSTPGMTVTVYGTSAVQLSSATAWTRLAEQRTINDRSTTITLQTASQSYRFVLLWISKAPAGATGSATGRVKVNEIELFPPSAG